MHSSPGLRNTTSSVVMTSKRARSPELTASIHAECASRMACPSERICKLLGDPHRWRLLTKLLGQPDNDALWPADVGEPVRVPVPHLADELGPVGEHARDDGVDVIDGEHNATEAQRVHRRVHGPEPDRVGPVALVQLDALAI